MFELQYTSQFKKDLKLLKKRSPDKFVTLLHFVEKLCLTGYEGVDKKFKPHTLKGNYKDCCECHLLNDYLLIWREDLNNNIIVLIRTGTHSDLF
jgi:mRNA interferase YafQ